MATRCRAAAPALPLRTSYPRGWRIRVQRAWRSILAWARTVGAGDGGANPDSVSGWSTGDALARQVQDLRGQNAGGWALYRYGSLFGAGAPEQAAAECAAPADGHWQRNVKNQAANRTKRKAPPGLFLQYGTGQTSCTAPENAVYYICICSGHKNRGEGMKKQREAHCFVRKRMKMKKGSLCC